MTTLLPPPRNPPPVTLADHDGLKRIHHQLYLFWLTAGTILITVWLMTLGTIPGILGLVTAKHILVAILAMGLGVDSRETSEQS